MLRTTLVNSFIYIDRRRSRRSPMCILRILMGPITQLFIILYIQLCIKIWTTIRTASATWYSPKGGAATGIVETRLQSTHLWLIRDTTRFRSPPLLKSFRLMHRAMGMIRAAIISRLTIACKLVAIQTSTFMKMCTRIRNKRISIEPSKTSRLTSLCRPLKLSQMSDLWIMPEVNTQGDQLPKT